MLQQFPNYTLTHIYREGNKTVDHLAELGHHANKGTTILQDPAPEIHPFLQTNSKDIMSLNFNFII